MPKLLFSVPLSPWHELCVFVGVRRSFVGVGEIPTNTDYAIHAAWLAGAAVAIMHPK